MIECYSLNPDLDGILAKSRDYNELLFAWHGWRNGTGPHIKPHYEKYVSLMNTLAKASNYSDAGLLINNDYLYYYFILRLVKEYLISYKDN